MFPSESRQLKDKENSIIFYILALIPAFLYLGIFFIYPLFLSIYYSFTNISLLNINNFNFVGFFNYTRLFTSSVFEQSIVITIVFFVFSAVIGQMFFGAIVAYVINGTNKFFGTIITLTILMAWATPQVVSGITWYSTLSYVPMGLANYILNSIGVAPIHFLSFHNALYMIIIANAWLGMGFSVLLFSSAIKNINPSVIKATVVDGAGSFSRFFRIIFPMLKQTILTDMILITLWTLGAFTLIFVLTHGGPSDSTNILTIYQYNTAFSVFNVGLANAIGVIIILAGVIMSLLYLKVIKIED